MPLTRYFAPRLYTLFAAILGATPLQVMGEAKLAKQQSGIVGLVVVNLGPANMASAATKMNCTAISGDADTLVRFNQDVGVTMHKALAEVLKYLEIKHGKMPSGYKIEIAFEDKYAMKDGPSAAVACALMLHSLITGNELDANFAVTGDMNADGSVQPVGGVSDKVRGAVASKCSAVAIPASTEKAMMDKLILEGPAAFWQIPVFTIQKFDDALAIASTKRSPSITQALAQFAELQAVMAKGNSTLLANPKVQEKLKIILQSAPNCLSAKWLALVGQGRYPKTLSVGGSLEQIDKTGTDLLGNIRDPRPEGLNPDTLATAMASLRKLRGKLDPRTMGYADALIDFGDTLRAAKNAPPRGSTEGMKVIQRLTEAGNKVDAAVAKLRNDKSLVEDMMK